LAALAKMLLLSSSWVLPHNKARETMHSCIFFLGLVTEKPQCLLHLGDYLTGAMGFGMEQTSSYFGWLPAPLTLTSSYVTCATDVMMYMDDLQFAGSHSLLKRRRFIHLPSHYRVARKDLGTCILHVLPILPIHSIMAVGCSGQRSHFEEDLFPSHQQHQPYCNT